MILRDIYELSGRYRYGQNFTRFTNEVIKQLDDLEVQRNLPRATY